MKRWMIVFLLLFVCGTCTPASSEGSDITLAADTGTPVLILQRTLNFRESDARCGTAYWLFADGTLHIYFMYARSDMDQPVLSYEARIAQEEYRAIEQQLNAARVIDMPDVIENDVLDGDTVTLRLWTTAGEKMITSLSPGGLPFGDVVNALEGIFRAYVEGEPPTPPIADSDECMPPEPTYTPDMPEYHVQEGDLHYRHGEYEDAIASYETATAIDLDYMNGYYGLAMTYRAMGLLELSIENYAAVMSLAPDYAQPYASRAEVYVFLRRYEEAEADLNHYVEIYGQYPIPYISRGDFYMDRGEYQRAADDYSMAMEKGIAASALSGLHLKRAEAWLKLGDIDSAAADLDAALTYAE